MRKVTFLTLILALASTATLADNASDGGAFTMWAVIFNAPENCSDGICDGDDVEVNPGPPRTAVVYLAGMRVPASGATVVGGDFAEGQTYGALPFPSTTLEDVDRAEIHLILRSHGRYMPVAADAQITTFDGGCAMQDCTDLQFAVFAPGEGSVQQVPVQRFADERAVPLAWATLYREEGGFRAAVHTDMRPERPTCAN